MRTAGMLGVAGGLSLVVSLVVGLALAQVERIHKPRCARTYASHEYIPMYPGDNELRLRGADVHTATGLALPPGIADVVQLRGKSIDSSGVGELSAFIRIKPTVHGKISVRVTYPADAPSDEFKARVYRRGMVRTLEAPERAHVGTPIRIRVEGEELGVASLRAGGSAYRVKRLGGTDRGARFELRFKQCGTLWLGPGLLHDAQVPYAEVVSGEAGYRGTTHKPIEVGALPGLKCPAVETNRPANLPFCPVGKRWDPRQRACRAK